MFFTVTGGFLLFSSVMFLLLGEFLNSLYVFLISIAFLYVGYKIKKKQDDEQRIFSLAYKEKRDIENEKTKSEYNNFLNHSMVQIGMTIDEVKSICETAYILDSQIQKTSAQLMGICPTCGGNIVDGTCQYCGNSYRQNCNITVLTYKCKYGKKIYTFNNGKLESIYTDSKPLNSFLK